jgi:DNA-binding IclR family transcriptional regulator
LAAPRQEIEAIIAQLGGALSRYGGMDAERLRLLTNATRERGWSVIGNHAAEGALAIGVAVRRRQGPSGAAGGRCERCGAH